MIKDGEGRDDDTKRIIFESGVELIRAENNLWAFGSDPQKQLKITLLDFFRTYKVRPIVEESHDLCGNTYTLLLSLCGKKILNLELTGFTQTIYKRNDLLHNISVLNNTENIHYLLGSVCYHCEKLALNYVGICYEYAKFSNILRGKKAKQTYYGGQFLAYYEFDALITCVIQAYNTLRHMIWYGFTAHRSSLPGNFIKVLQLSKDIPSILLKRLELSWNNFGNKANDYRDCIQHYIPVGYCTTSAEMTELENGIWATSLFIPDNPEVRSKDKFRYDSRIDALTFSWQLTNEVLEIVQVIAKNIPNRPPAEL